MINKLALRLNILNTKDDRREHMRDHVGRLESQSARLETMQSELDDSVKLTIMIDTLRDNPEYEPLIA